MTHRARDRILARARRTACSTLHAVTDPLVTIHRFTRSDIESLAPQTEGCYALYSGDVCVYVGSGNLRRRLLAHFEGDIYCISLHRPRRWFQYHCEDPEAEARRLIRELRPRCNPRLE